MAWPVCDGRRRARPAAVGPSGRRKHGVHGPPRISAGRRSPPPRLGRLCPQRQDDRQALSPRGLPTFGYRAGWLALDGPARLGEAPRQPRLGGGSLNRSRQHGTFASRLSHRAGLPPSGQRRRATAALAGPDLRLSREPSRIAADPAAGLATAWHLRDCQRPALARRSAANC